MKKVKVAVWGGKHVVYMPMYVALREGLFEKSGLMVLPYPVGNDDDIHQEVALGKAHFGVGDPTFVATKVPGGQPCKVLGALVNNVCSWGYTHHPEIHPMKSPEDLVGLRFGTFPKPSTTYSLLAHLKKSYPKQLRSAEIVQAPIGKLTPLLASGKVDVIIEVEPMISLAAEQGLRIVLSLQEFYPSFLFTGVTSAVSTIQNEPEVCQKFISAIQAALTICCRAPDTLLSVACEMFPALSRATMAQAMQRMLDIRAWPEQTLVQAQSWTNALKLREELKELHTIKEPTALLEQSFAYRAVTS